MSLKIAVNGAGGRMGQAVIAAAFELDGFALVGGAGRPGSSCIGEDLGAIAGARLAGISVQADFSCFADADVVVDFSAPAALFDLLDDMPAGAALVSGTTGLNPDQQRAVVAAAAERPVVQAGNFSVGVNLLAGLVERAAARLGEDWDIEVFETHHRRKVDAPSGTALMLGEAAASGRGVPLSRRTPADRSGPRKAGDIGFAVSRAGGVVGEHAVSFTSERERVTLSHDAFDRAIFAEGALRAARWAHGRKPGLYDMGDVLSLKA